MTIKHKTTKIEGLILIEGKRHDDHRGFFSETYNYREYKKIGIDIEFIQDNHSKSFLAGTLRGLHFQNPPKAQAKLIRCSIGSIYDVVVDIRKGSPTFGRWEGFNLTANNANQLYIPIGFAHGFMTLESNSEILYKCSDYYSPENEGSLLWDDKDININWPLEYEPILSEKDENAVSFRNLNTSFVYKDNL